MSDNDLDRDRLMPLVCSLFVPSVAAVEFGRSEGKGTLRRGDDTPPGPLIPPPFNNVEPGGGGGVDDRIGLYLDEFEICGGNGGNMDAAPAAAEVPLISLFRCCW